MSHTSTSGGCSEQPCLEPQVLEEASMFKPFGFRVLPAELRLRILRHTHLGPPETGGYTPYFDKIFVRDGKLNIDNFNPFLQISRPCQYRSWHGSSTPRCRCRMLPMALFLVDRLMYREASEVFYSHAFLDFYGNDLGTALTILRRFPPESQQRLRRLQFTMTAAQFDGWGAGALASGYPKASLDEVARSHWDGGPRPEFDYQADWRAIVSFLAENTDLPRLSLDIDMDLCGWAFVEVKDMLVWDDLDFAWYTFAYDLFLGIATSLCPLKELGAVHFELCLFKSLEPWLEREVMGCRKGYGDLESLPKRWGYGNHIPSWHDMDQRLEGSNYHPAS